MPEYWLVDLVAGAIVVHRDPVGAAYRDVATHRDGMLGVPAGGAPLDVAALLARAR